MQESLSREEIRKAIQLLEEYFDTDDTGKDPNKRDEALKILREQLLE